MKLVIDRSTWLRGKLDNWEYDSALLSTHYDGKKCCLGFLALKCGFTEEQIADKDMPYDVYEEPKKNKTVWRELIEVGQVEGTEDYDSVPNDISAALASINDSESLSDKERERRLIKKFKTIGVDVTFKN
jgi:hypothetical protein